MKKNNALLFLLLLLMICSCKKNNARRNTQADTFLKLYDVPIQRNHKSNNTTIASSGAMVTDAEGNIYVWYYDSTISKLGRIAILKTDKNGKKIWNASYIPLMTAAIDVDLANNEYFNQNLVCIGQSLFICGRDSSQVQNFLMLKINCSDGSVAARYPINFVAPSYRPFFILWDLWPTSDGNLLISCWSAPGGGFITPVLCEVDQSGNMKWMNSNFPSRYADSINFSEKPCCIQEVSGGNYLYGTMGFYNYTDSSGNSLTSSTLYIRHINSSGNVVGTDSLCQGTSNSSDYPPFINSTGAAQIFYLFPSTLGGYIIVSMETYDLNADARIKVLKTTSSLVVTDSSYISLGNSVLSSIAQDKSGNVIMSIFNQVLPLPNAICNIYKVAPNGSVSKPVEIGLPDQSAFISGICPTNDGHILMTGLIQSGNVDVNNLFILKTDNNEHY